MRTLWFISLPALVSIFIVHFVEWPIKYHVVTDPLYETMGLNYLYFFLDFFVFFFFLTFILGLLELSLTFVVFKNLFKEVGEEES